MKSETRLSEPSLTKRRSKLEVISVETPTPITKKLNGLKYFFLLPPYIFLYHLSGMNSHAFNEQQKTFISMGKGMKKLMHDVAHAETI